MNPIGERWVARATWECRVGSALGVNGKPVAVTLGAVQAQRRLRADAGPLVVRNPALAEQAVGQS